MSTPIDIDALIAEARNFRYQTQTPAESVNPNSMVGLWLRTADALESTAAELRQERERADEAQAYASHALADRAEAQADLTRAREVIDRVRAAVVSETRHDWLEYSGAYRILTAYHENSSSDV